MEEQYCITPLDCNCHGSSTLTTNSLKPPPPPRRDIDHQYPSRHHHSLPRWCSLLTGIAYCLQWHSNGRKETLLRVIIGLYYGTPSSVQTETYSRQNTRPPFGPSLRSSSSITSSIPIRSRISGVVFVVYIQFQHINTCALSLHTYNVYIDLILNN